MVNKDFFYFQVCRRNSPKNVIFDTKYRFSRKLRIGTTKTQCQKLTQIMETINFDWFALILNSLEVIVILKIQTRFSRI